MHKLIDKFFTAVLTHRKTVLVITALLLVASALCIPFVKINYQFSDYLPSDSPSTVALHIMNDAFDGESVPNARMMVEGIDEVKAAELADTFETLSGVTSLIWLGTVVDTSVPLAVYDDSLLEAYKVGDSYLYQLGLDTAVGGATIDELRAIAYEKGATNVAFAGEAVNTAMAQGSSDAEIQLIMIMAIIVIIGLLLLTSTAWFEPVLFISVIGISIVFNLGTNIIFGEISFITQMCAAILQLAVSMDYGIVMLHTYRSFIAAGFTPFESARKAMFKASAVIASSAATTFFGFLSLCVMAFLIGMDMGLVLAKGIVFSFLSVLIILPVLILSCQKVLDKTTHRYLLPSFKGFARVCMRLTVPFTLIICLIVIPAFLAQQRPNYVYGASGFVEPGTELYDNTQQVDNKFGAKEQWALLVPTGDVGREKALISELEKLPYVNSITSYVSTVSERIPLAFVPQEAQDQFVSNGWSRIIVATSLEGESDESFGLVQQIRDVGNSFYPDQAYLVGSAVTSYDMSQIVTSDSMRILLASVLAITVVLLFMFWSLLIPLILVLTIEISIWINLAIPYFMGTEIQYIGYLIISAIMLGATVDYAIILSKSYLDNRKIMEKRAAMHAALSNSAVTILTSATILTLCGAFIGLISTNGVIAGLGTLIGRGAFIAALNTFLLLPTLFMVFDKPIAKTTWHANFYEPKAATAAAVGVASATNAADITNATAQPAAVHPLPTVEDEAYVRMLEQDE